MINSDYRLKCEHCQALMIPVIENHEIYKKPWLIYRCTCSPNDEFSMPLDRFNLEKIHPSFRPDRT